MSRLVQDVDKKVKYRLDVDRYIEGAVDAGKLVELLGTFVDDIFAVSVAVMGSDLKARMPERSS